MCSVLLTLGPTSHATRPLAGPGITVDEPFNVYQGFVFAETARQFGIAVVDPLTLVELFDVSNNDHPPLGRLWIGVSEKAVRVVAGPGESGAPYSVACARTAPASAFALLVFLVGYAASVWYGRTAGFVTASAIVLMPRLFGHAHIASLETFINLTYAAATLSVARFWCGSTPPRWKTACYCGMALGLALLTKVQAVLLPVPVVLWSIIVWRRRALLPLLVWGLTGVAVFFVGWPYLWTAPIDHLLEYLGRTTDRASLPTWYLGLQYADHDVPWHFPLVMFLVTVPVGLQALGFFGVFTRRSPVWHSSRDLLVLACAAFPMIVFSLPGSPVYDGARLFLVSFPLWAIFIGRGAQHLLDWLTEKWSRRSARWLLFAFVGFQAWGVVAMAPCWLSYHNLLVGGLKGAQRAGLEVSYWGDSLTEDLLREAVAEIPRGSTLDVVPVLHRFHLPEMMQQIPSIREHGLRLRAFDWDNRADIRYLLVFRRLANLSHDDLELHRRSKVIAEVRRQGVLLAAVYQLPQKTR